MPRLSRAAALAGAALLASACYRVTVISGPVPAATANAVVDKPWNHSFVIGLVPPPPLDVSRPCGGNVSQVVTQRSFLNGLVSALTYNIYTPLQITVTCAGPRATSTGVTAEQLGVVASAPAPADSAAAKR